MNETLSPSALPRVARLQRPRRRVGVPAGAKAAFVAFLVSCCIALFSKSPFVVIASGSTLALMLVLLWRDDEPPILLFPALFQWTAVAVKPILSAVQHVPINALSNFGGNIEAAAYFGLASLAALTIGMRIGLGRSSRNWDNELRFNTLALPFRPVLIVSVILLLVGHTLGALAVYIGPLRQLFLALSGLGGAGVFVLSYWCLRARKNYTALAVVMVFEIAVGMTGFFADFRSPILILCIAALCARGRMKARDVAALATAGTLLISLAVFWSAVKLDYRMFVSGGTMDQVVTVPLDERLNYMGRQISTFDGQRYADGLDLLLKRQSYIDFLANTLDYVPRVLPHENGARVGRTFLHIITPRVFFPNKPPTENDTEVTLKYTGIPLQVREQTSISIGYLGELYIDLGIIGSALACAAGGWAFGVGYRRLRSGSRAPLLLRYALMAVVALSLATFDTALIKLVGGTVTVFISAYLLQRFVFLRLVGLTSLRPTRRSLRFAYGPGK